MSKQSQKSQKREERKAAQRAEAQAQANKQKMMFVAGVVLVVVGFALLLRLVFGGSSAPVVEGETTDPLKGNPDAAVVISEYSDFQCPACQQMAPLLSQIVEDYDNVAVEYNDFPLQSIHPNAFEAAEAGQCAHQQGLFWEYHDTLFAEQATWSGEGNPTGTFVEYAVQVGANEAEFEECLTSHAMRSSVREDIAEADSADITGTPTLFINGERWANTGTYAGLAAAVESALEAAGESTSEDATGEGEADATEDETEQPVEEDTSSES